MKKSQLAIALVLSLIAATGCSRERYRVRADIDAYTLIAEKTATTPWDLPDFHIETDIDSRLSHQSCIDDPLLPDPTPTLYGFQVPPTPTRSTKRFFGSNVNQSIPTSESVGDDIVLASYDVDDSGSVDEVEPPNLNVGSDNASQSPDALGVGEIGDSRPVVPISTVAWDSIPKNCLVRVVEFQSIREEYQRTYETTVSKSLFDTSEKLALEDLLSLAVKHSREYQTAKETLYRAALQLSLQRFAFQTKFGAAGNGTDIDWQQDRVGGLTDDSVGINSNATIDRVLTTGGTILARFANSVVLTFNGPSGFATDIGSDLLAEITQPLLQRDIVFEGLTQAERDVVYAARDYARFRKQFFRDIAGSYYSLLLTYRSIEIDMLDFFANQRGFDQAKAEFEKANRIPPFQVDQFEQNALNSRSRVISSCNNLERGFDQLKLRLGIPVETAINLDLRELELITASDEVMVANELARRRLTFLERQQANIDDIEAEREDLVNKSTQLVQKLEGLLEVQSRLRALRIDDETNDASSEDVSADSDLETVTSMIDRLKVESAVIAVKKSRIDLQRELDGRNRTLFLIDVRLNHIGNLIKLGVLQRNAYGVGASPQLLQSYRQQLKQTQRDRDDIYEQISSIGNSFTPESVELKQRQLARYPEIADRLKTLVDEIEASVPTQERLDTQTLVSDAIELGKDLRTGVAGGLAPITIDGDEAMLTALVSRFDLMNERGALADAWRQIKLAGDDLRSVLNLRASHTIDTDPTNDRAFDFTFEESQTTVGLTFDLPLNRRAQRNVYRVALINYNLALRNLTQLEDNIKFGIRDDLRNLQLDREQYAIAVASAALASDRRFGTRIQFQLQQGNVRARDVLEAQQAYTASLNSVASAHIDYILDRIDLFLNLELLQVSEQNFWPELYKESYSPESRVLPATGVGAAYGELPSRVHYSDCIRRMEGVPFGRGAILRGDELGQGRLETIPFGGSYDDEVEAWQLIDPAEDDVAPNESFELEAMRDASEHLDQQTVTTFEEVPLAVEQQTKNSTTH